MSIQNINKIRQLEEEIEEMDISIKYITNMLPKLQILQNNFIIAKEVKIKELEKLSR